MDVDALLAQIGVEASCEIRRDGRWVEVADLGVRAMAQVMRAAPARWVTMTVSQVPSGGHRIIYHWDLDGELLNIVTAIDGSSVPSIADIWPAADWVEREMRDYYALTFDGRADTAALMLREGDEPGLFSRTAQLGRDQDPADSVRQPADPSAGEVLP